MVVARHPMKFFISFQASESDGNAFFFTAYYSKTPTLDLYVNALVCDDKGESVADLNKSKSADENGSVKNNNDAGENILIRVTSISDRKN